MTDQSFLQEIDPNPLVAALVEKTKAGRLIWQPTASPDTFIASVGGETTLKLMTETDEEFDEYGQLERITVPVLSMADPKGRQLWQIRSREVSGGLWPLYRLGQRVANKVDERVAALLEAVQSL
jgi:hypothetical protein